MMCGIVGILNHNGSIPNINKIKKMSDLIKDRGPDEHGYFNKKFIAIGHCRLSILDL